MNGSQLIERAILMKNRLGTKVAALWFEKQGVNFEFGIVALVGSNRARAYGVHVGRVARQGWNR